MRVAFIVVCAALLVAGCGEGREDGDTAEESPAADGRFEFPEAPEAEDGALDPRASEALSDLSLSTLSGRLDEGSLDVVASSGDARLAWLLSDFLRFAQSEQATGQLVSTLRS